MCTYLCACLLSLDSCLEADVRCTSAGAFSVGVPERFVANYKASRMFLERLEALSSTASALNAFRGSMAYQSWLDRWKLSVYYGLCFQVCVYSWCAKTILAGIGC